MSISKGIRKVHDPCPHCGGRMCGGCPSADEIQQRAAEIRAGWDSATERSRRTGSSTFAPPVETRVHKLGYL